jgi:FtsZ-binding cell division protein ZapB
MSEFEGHNEAAAEHGTAHEGHSHGHESEAAAGTLTMSTNDFSALEERIHRAVEVVRRERQARLEAEDRAARAEAQLRDQSPLLEQLEKDLSALRLERDQVRERVERLLGQLDALEL